MPKNLGNQDEEQKIVKKMEEGKIQGSRELLRKIMLQGKFKVPEEIIQKRKRFQAKMEKSSKAVPSEFFCPLTQEILCEPVSARDGVTYEKYAIELWLRELDVSPKTAARLESKELLPNIAIREIINQYFQE